MKREGWIKLYRSLLDCEIWADAEPFDKRSAWIDLLMMANYENGEFYQGDVRVKLKKGQLFTSVRYLSQRWRWSRHKVSNFLGTLSGTQMVTLSGTPSGTVITIENYAKFQSRVDDAGTPAGTPSGTQTGTNTKKNISKKNISKEKENYKKKSGETVWGDSQCE